MQFLVSEWMWIQSDGRVYDPALDTYREYFFCPVLRLTSPPGQGYWMVLASKLSSELK